MKTQVSTAGGAAGLAPAVPPSPDELPQGAKCGPWIVERELGRGGMGAVYAVVHEDIGKRAALKIVHRKLLTPAFNIDRVMLEAKVVNTVGHPNIVDIFETGKLEDGRPYVVMERLEGRPLSHRADDGKILPDQVIEILLQICDALIAAHAVQIVHRDLKLDNVFLVDNPDDPHTPKVKLLDWGIAKVINHDVRHTVEGQLVGTPQYLSPEQARGADVTTQSDVYSLGVMAYELFLEQLPFEAETSAEIMAMHLRAIPPAPRELWPDIPEHLEDLIVRMLAKDPDNRPTMLDVARRFELIRSELRERCVPVHQVIVRPSQPRLDTPRPRAELESQSRRGCAPTEPAEWPPRRRRRSRYAIGVAALATSTLMFLWAGERDAQIADAALPAPLPERAPPAPVATDVVTAPDLPVSPPNLAAVVMSSAELEARPPARRTPAASNRTSTRKAPATPRRAARIDPDGTIDPYR